MVALPAVPSVIQLAFQTTNTDNDYVDVNRIHVHYTGTAPTSGDLTSFATTAITAWASAFCPSMSDDKEVTGLVAIDLTSPTAATAEVVSSTAGALSGAILPADVCFVMAETVARRFRGGHPRMYLPLGDETKLVDSGHWTAAFITAVELANEGLVVAMAGAGWAGAGTILPVSVSYYEGSHLVTYPSGRHRDVPTLRGGGPVVDQITNYVGRAKLGTQRRRLGR